MDSLLRIVGMAGVGILVILFCMFLSSGKKEEEDQGDKK